MSPWAAVGEAAATLWAALARRLLRRRPPARPLDTELLLRCREVSRLYVVLERREPAAPRAEAAGEDPREAAS